MTETTFNGGVAVEIDGEVPRLRLKLGHGLPMNLDIRVVPTFKRGISATESRDLSTARPVDSEAEIENAAIFSAIGKICDGIRKVSRLRLFAHDDRVAVVRRTGDDDSAHPNQSAAQRQRQQNRDYRPFY